MSYDEQHNTLSGPELSVEVARKVMGWKANLVNGECWRLEQTDDAGKMVYGYWAPHELIQDAWEVMEKMRNEATVTVRLFPGGKGAAAKVEGWPWVYAETAPLAICLAALKAMKA